MKASLAAPHVLVIISIGVWAVVLLASGFGYSYEIDPVAWVWLIIAISAALLGSIAGTHIVRRPNPQMPQMPDLATLGRGAVHFVFWLSLAGFLIRLITGRGALPFGSSTEIAVSRVSTMADAGVSLSDIGTPLAAFGVVAAILLGYIPKSKLGTVSFLLALFSVTQYLLWNIAVGGRTGIVYISVAFLLGFLCRPGRRRIRPRLVFILLAVAIIGAIAFVWLSDWLLAGRLDDQGRNTTAALAYMSREHAVILPEWVQEANASDRGTLAYTAVSLIHYMLHGLFEYGYLFTWREFPATPLGWGQVTFAPIPQMLLGLFDASPVPQYELSPRFGVYQGLYGALLSDFGPMGMVLTMFLIGAVAGIFYIRTRTGAHTLGFMMLYAPLGVILLAAPFFNAFSGAGGMYVLIACLLTTVWVSLWQKYEPSQSIGLSAGRHNSRAEPTHM